MATNYYLSAHTAAQWQFLPTGGLLDFTFGVVDSHLQNGLLCNAFAFKGGVRHKLPRDLL